MLISPEDLASRRELEAKIKSAAHYRRIAQSKGLPCENPDPPAAIRAGSDTPNRKENRCRNPPPPCCYQAGCMSMPGAC